MNVSDFEKDLKRAMRRVDAPEGFADRVMGRVAGQECGRLLQFAAPGSPGRYWVAVAAVLLVAVAFGFGLLRERRAEREHQEQAKARAAAEQFALAMEVTGRTLFVVQQRIDRAGTKHVRGVE